MDEGKEDAEREEKEDEEMTQENLPNMEVFAAYDDCFTLSEPRHSGCFISLVFSQDESQPSFASRHSSHWRKPPLAPRWACMPRDGPYGYCRSLSSSMENMVFPGAPLSPKRGSFSSLNEAINRECMFDRRGFRDDASLQCSKSQGKTPHTTFMSWVITLLPTHLETLVHYCFFVSAEWLKSPDFSHDSDSRGKIHSRKTVKIKETIPDPVMCYN